MSYYLRHIGWAAVLLGWGSSAAAQSFDSVGTRAAGMAGAFVAVADDASAAYWNPAGFASGNLFSIVLDRSTSKSDPAAPAGAGRERSFLFAMGMPALGLSYYQVRHDTVSAGLKAGTTEVSTAGLKAGTTEVSTAGLKAGTTEVSTAGLKAVATEVSTAGLKAGATEVSTGGLKAGTTGVSTAGVRAGTVERGLKAGGARAEEADEVRIETLMTHHTGATVVQSIGPGIAVGATLKVVRGIASAQVVADARRATLLDHATELGGKGSSKFDTDIGVMKAGSLFKAGLTIRNVTNPEFETPEGDRVRLRRQARAGLAIVPLDGWVIDADLDLTSIPGVLGSVRDFAIGTEGRLGRKTFIRGGLRTNTRHGSDTALAAGASYMMVTSVLIDAQVTGGDGRTNRGWGISARLVY